MEKHISFTSLLNENFYSTMIECHRQIWEEGTSWKGYATAPRFTDALFLICSDIEITYLMSDGSKMIGRKGDIIYAPKGICYTAYFKNGGADPDLYTINFNLRSSNDTELRFGSSMQKLFSETRPELYHMANELSSIYLNYKDNKLKRQAYFLSLLNAILELICRHSEDYYPIRHGVELFLSEWDKNEKIGRYAEICGLSESCFYLHFKAWAKMSPAEYRNNIRISAAKSFLKYSTLSIQDIAAKTGFSDPFYFSRLFRKMTGVSPQHYRNNM